MRVLLAGFLTFFCALQGFAQFADSFEDGELYTAPTWYFDTSQFEVSVGKLHSKNSAGGTQIYQIAARNTFPNESYKFDFEFLANPSSTNYIDFFIAADSTPLYANNGYFIRIGNTKDEISFYKKTTSGILELISGKDGELNKSSNTYSVYLHRLNNNLWQLYYRAKNSAFWLFQGEFKDTGSAKLYWMGIKIYQTGSGVIGKHYFDNIRFGKTEFDTTKPKVIKAYPVYANKVMAVFSEPMGDINKYDFRLSGAVADSLIIDSTRTMATLYFQSPLIRNHHYVLQHFRSTDTAGNYTDTSYSYFFTLLPEIPLPGEIIFTEVMAKPTPVISTLPAQEYLEIKNTGPRYLKLGGCVLKDNRTVSTLPDSVLAPYAHLVIAGTSATNWPDPLKVVRTPNFPGLNNDRDTLIFFNQNQEWINYLAYSETWHETAVKRSGGWSLELIDTAHSCISQNNWTSNKTIGGTPGISNSVYGELRYKPDFKPVQAFLVDDTTLGLRFNENPDKSSLTASEILFPDGECNFRSINKIDLIAKTVHINISPAISDWKIHRVTLNNVSSCFGTICENTTLRFGRSKAPENHSSVLFNEVLFNPLNNDPDFIELYNATDTIIDINGIYLSTETPVYSGQVIQLNENHTQIFPHEYAALTTDMAAILNCYPKHDEKQIFQVNALPLLPNGGGFISLTNRFSTIIDSFSFNDKMHSPVLISGDGVSLEKINPTWSSADANNWTSAASTWGYASPGIQNSQYSTTIPATQIFSIENKWFSPDNDGYEDLLQIKYEFKLSGCILNTFLFSESGALIEHIHKSEILSPQGAIIWDGKTAKGTILPGNYVLKLEAYHTNGKKFQDKITFSVLTSQ